MRTVAHCHGISLVELLVSMAASVVILGGLLLSAAAIRKTMHGSEVYAGSYSDQRRLIDYIGRDLRRAIAVACTDAGGTRQSLRGVVEIADRATLIATLPGYYKGNSPSDPGFEEALAVVRADDRFDYGNGSSAAPTVEVTFRKLYAAQQHCVCFLRQEGDAEEVIVRDADNLHVQVELGPDGRTGLVKAWFRGPYSGVSPLVSTYDELMLRNSLVEETR